MPVAMAAIVVIAAGVGLVTAEPRPPRSPPPLVLSGTIAAFVSLAPVAAALADEWTRPAIDHEARLYGCGCATCRRADEYALERKGYVAQAEAWRRRAERAEARVAALEADLDRHRDALKGLLDEQVLIGNGYCGPCDSAGGHHEEGCPVAEACEVLETYVSQATSVVLAEEPADG